MNHDCGKECAAAVREATAPLREEIERQKRYVQLYISYCDGHAAFRKTLDATIAERDATIMELRDHLSQANASLAEIAGAASQIEWLEGENTGLRLEFALTAATLDEMAKKVAELNYVVDEFTRENLNLKDRLAEMTRCRTAADVQHLRERQELRQRAMATEARINREARERQQGETWPQHVDPDEGLPTAADVRGILRGASRGTFGREDLAT
jgi:predicted RNase H-like nuclease (RuvC/YqgF family)